MTSSTPTEESLPAQSENPIDSDKQAPETPFLADKRHPFVVAFLYFLTFGVYSSFWLVAHVREFNKLQS